MQDDRQLLIFSGNANRALASELVGRLAELESAILGAGFTTHALALTGASDATTA